MTERRNATGAVAEPMSGIAPRKPRFDFGARTRANILDAQKYTRFVILMKRGLVLGAVALVGAVLAYAIQPRSQQKVAMTFEKMGLVAGDLAMVKPKLTGVDSDGNPYVVTADTALQDPKNMRRATLKNVDADLTQKGGKWTTIMAPNGWMDADAKLVRLTGAVSVFTDDGFEMHTTLANVDMARGTAVGPNFVWGHGPQGKFYANHFRIARLGSACTHTPKGARSTKGAKSSKQAAAKPVLPICAPLSVGNVAQKQKPMIYLIGSVHMTLYPQKSAKKAKKA